MRCTGDPPDASCHLRSELLQSSLTQCRFRTGSRLPTYVAVGFPVPEQLGQLEQRLAYLEQLEQRLALLAYLEQLELHPALLAYLEQRPLPEAYQVVHP